VIIVVDDNDMVRRLVAGLLRDKGFEVFDAAGGPEALAACRRDAAGVQMLVTDIEMPGMNGRELAKRVAAIRPGVRVIYMSGLSRAAVERAGALQAWESYLGKPFTPAQLSDMIRTLMGDPKDPSAAA